MSALRLLLVITAVAMIVVIMSRTWGDRPSEISSLLPTSADASSEPVATTSAVLGAIPDPAPSSRDRRTPGAPEASIEAEAPAPMTASATPLVVSPDSNLELQRALITEIALLEAERDALRVVLGPLTTDAYKAAFDRSDFVEFAAAPTGDDIEGKLCAVRRAPDDGPYRLVALPRAGFEEAYRIFDMIREKSDQIQTKKAELNAARSGARAQ